MKLNSAYFDKIRIDSGEPRVEPTVRPCSMRGCEAPGTHRAPKGRLAEGEYFWFCLDHVRDYNKSYNYFSGMNDAAVQAYQKDALIGHRPTWRMGVDAGRDDAAAADRPLQVRLRHAGRPVPRVRRRLRGEPLRAERPKSPQHGGEVAENART